MTRLLAVFLVIACAAIGAASPERAGMFTTASAQPSHRQPGSYLSKTTSVRIYLIALNGGGTSGTTIGCGDAVVPVVRPIPRTNAPLTAALRLLLSGHHRYYGQSGLYNALYRNRLTIQRVSIVNGRATVHLPGSLNLGGECDDPRVGAQLRQTALQFHTIRSVAFLVNGVPLRRLLSGR
jgi:spore germination protein GerM